MTRQRRFFLPLHTLATGLLLGLFFFLGACTVPSGPATPVQSVTTITPGITASPASTSVPHSNEPVAISTATIQADVVLTESEHQQLTTVKVGQIINVSDFPDHEWVIDFRPEVLSLLTPPEKVKQPGVSGWFFQAIAAGNTAIVLDSIPPPCPGKTPCPPNVIRFVFPIQVIP